MHLIPAQHWTWVLSICWENACQDTDRGWAEEAHCRRKDRPTLGMQVACPTGLTQTASVRRHMRGGTDEWFHSGFGLKGEEGSWPILG